MKLPDKRLIFFNSFVSPLDSEFKFPDERCGGKIRYCANRKQKRFNVDQSDLHTCVMLQYEILNGLTLTIH